MMDHEWIKVSVDLAQFVILGIIGWYNWQDRRRDARAAQIKALETEIDQRLDVMTARMTRVETLIEEMPDHSDLGAIHEKMNRTSEDVSRIAGEMKGINATLSLIHEYLLNGGHK